MDRAPVESAVGVTDSLVPDPAAGASVGTVLGVFLHHNLTRPPRAWR